MFEKFLCSTKLSIFVCFLLFFGFYQQVYANMNIDHNSKAIVFSGTITREEISKLFTDPSLDNYTLIVVTVGSNMARFTSDLLQAWVSVISKRELNSRRNAHPIVLDMHNAQPCEEVFSVLLWYLRQGAYVRIINLNVANEIDLSAIRSWFRRFSINIDLTTINGLDDLNRLVGHIGMLARRGCLEQQIVPLETLEVTLSKIPTNESTGNGWLGSLNSFLQSSFGWFTGANCEGQQPENTCATTAATTTHTDEGWPEPLTLQQLAALTEQQLCERMERLRIILEQRVPQLTDEYRYLQYLQQRREQQHQLQHYHQLPHQQQVPQQQHHTPQVQPLPAPSQAYQFPPMQTGAVNDYNATQLQQHQQHYHQPQQQQQQQYPAQPPRHIHPSSHK
jgi:hypothetical protein